MAKLLKPIAVAALTVWGHVLEGVEAAGQILGLQGLSDWANDRWADVAENLDGVLNGPS